MPVVCPDSPTTCGQSPGRQRAGYSPAAPAAIGPASAGTLGDCGGGDDKRGGHSPVAIFLPPLAPQSLAVPSGPQQLSLSSHGHVSLSYRQSDKETQRKMSTTTTVTASQAAGINAETILRLFPDIDTTNTSELDGHDAEQIRLMDEVCIVLDENDEAIGTASKKVCTYCSRIRHREMCQHDG